MLQLLVDRNTIYHKMSSTSLNNNERDENIFEYSIATISAPMFFVLVTRSHNIIY